MKLVAYSLGQVAGYALMTWALTSCAGTTDRIAAKVADARNAYYAQCAGRPDDLECAMKRVSTNCLIDAYNTLNEELPEP